MLPPAFSGSFSRMTRSVLESQHNIKIFVCVFFSAWKSVPGAVNICNVQSCALNRAIANYANIQVIKS